MSSSSSTAVTIDREYFDTLVRRAQFNADSPKADGHLASVVISRAEYDSLMFVARQYGNLRRNLLRGGVGAETVDLLSQDDETIQGGAKTSAAPKADLNEDGGARLYTPAPPAASGGTYGPQKDVPHDGPHNRYQDRSTWADGDVGHDEDDENGASDTESQIEDPPGANYAKPQGQRQQFERQCVRTIQLSHLAEGTTHADIANAVRGGMLLDIFLRSHDRSAMVSFLRSVDAKKFYDHVRRHDLYIKNKRIEAKWNDRQFVLPGHVANKIGTGASRNLVIQGYDNRHTEEVIREDLDHIHNLVVVKIEFIGGSCYIGLNSVHNAISARQCMLSRLYVSLLSCHRLLGANKDNSRYKGKKINYDVDECAQPYPQPAPKVRKEMAPPKKGFSAVPNRFQLLNLDDGDEDEIAAPFQAKNSVGITA
ncbi:uncharacterized protein B0H64DRAFT_397775 [Chaetomium fimeti]|uniref:Negative regulator of differentiation 1 n=1 Tax=Chaetomium fimeti TaxID=1854472 RepID=A0AAE0HGS1_9PEZI|nr:hypothetical protein B0H64DRAFT_397775 [Chaetomium fimeti]